MKRTLFRILAFPLPTRSMRNYVRRLGGPRVVPPTKRITDILRATIDISAVSPAHGFLRYIQQANLQLLGAFDTFARKNAIEYFMIGGAIAGLIRYGKCVPWDDDIDVGMTAENYEKFLIAARKILPNDEYDLMLTSNVFRIVHKKTRAFLDILRYGVHSTPNCYTDTGANQIAYAQQQYNRVVQNKTFLKFYVTNKMSRTEISDIYAHIYAQHRDATKIQTELFSYIPGYDKTVVPIHTDGKPFEFYSFDTIFPIVRKRFDGRELYFPSDPELYATKCWGDIWQFPDDIFRTHEYTHDQSPSRLINLREYLKRDAKSIYDGFAPGQKDETK